MTDSPLAVVDWVELSKGRIGVVRDDLLPGGTKQRAAIPYLRGEIARGFGEFVYASPFCGFAQVALSAACARLGVDCAVFCELPPANEGPSGAFHEYSLLAQALGARLIACGTLAEAERLAEQYSASAAHRLKVPLGFDCEPFRKSLGVELRRQWGFVVADLSRLAPEPRAPLLRGRPRAGSERLEDPGAQPHSWNPGPLGGRTFR